MCYDVLKTVQYKDVAVRRHQEIVISDLSNTAVTTTDLEWSLEPVEPVQIVLNFNFVE